MQVKKLFIAFALGLGLTLALVWLLGGRLPVTRAASFNVNTTNDENDGCGTGQCSLRDAIIDANGNSQADTITLGNNTYVLTQTGVGENAAATGDLDITDILTIEGVGPGQTIIDASGVISDRVFDIRSGAGTVVISGVTIINGNVTGQGGGIYSYDADLTLINVEVISNAANGTGSSGRGGGVYVYAGNLLLDGAQIISNTAGSSGGGVYVDRGSATLSGGQVLSNTADYGGGVYVVSSAAFFTQTGDSIIAYNVSDWGGGVGVASGSAVLNGGRVVSNTASDQGGGVYVYQGSATLSGAQVISNTASDEGGGFYNNNGTLTLVNTTVSRNAAGDQGGGLYSYSGTSVLSYTTVASNTASVYGGIRSGSGGMVLFRNTVVAYNGPTNCGGTLVSNGHNLDSGATCGFAATGDITSTDPLLGPLTADGGTLVHPLTLGSPAIDEGLCLPAVTTVDQRGVTRPQGYGCDIGAYEAEMPVITVTKSGPARFSPQDRITYTLYVTNTGTLTATHVVLTDTLPTGAAFVTASDGGVAASGLVTWPVFSVPPGGGLVTRTFAVTATATITNADYRVSCAGGIGAAGSVVVVTEIGGYADMPVITVTKSGPARFSPQDRITYTLYVTNTGTLTATHVVLTDTLPTGAAFVTASDGGVAASGLVTWPVFSVPPGGGLVTRTFAVTATATITNADYRVSCAGGIGAAGSVVVVTEIGGYEVYLPLVLRNHQ